MIRIFKAWTAFVMCLVITGCGGASTDTDPTADPADNTDTVDSTVEPVVPAESPADRASEFPLNPPANAPAEDTPPEPATTDTPDPATTDTTAAEPGVGKKGQGYGGGLVSEPARQYFRIQERVVFQVQIPQALKMFNATSGKPPKTHDEFMEKIIKENDIKLPELPPGKKYVFDSEKGELMIQTGG